MSRTLASLMAVASLAIGCAPGNACLRLSDCATGSVCSAGACVPVSMGSDEGGPLASEQDASTSQSSTADAESADSEASTDAGDAASSDDAIDVDSDDGG